MKFLVIFLVALIPSVAMAQAQPQKFIPFVVEEQDAKNLRIFLDEQPLKTGLPILQWMDSLEQKALAKAAAESSAGAASGGGGGGGGGVGNK